MVKYSSLSSTVSLAQYTRAIIEMSNPQSLISGIPGQSRYSDLTKALEGDDYKFTNSKYPLPVSIAAANPSYKDLTAP